MYFRRGLIKHSVYHKGHESLLLFTFYGVGIMLALLLVAQ